MNIYWLLATKPLVSVAFLAVFVVSNLFLESPRVFLAHDSHSCCSNSGQYSRVEPFKFTIGLCVISKQVLHLADIKDSWKLRGYLRHLSATRYICGPEETAQWLTNFFEPSSVVTMWTSTVLISFVKSSMIERRYRKLRVVHKSSPRIIRIHILLKR